MKQRPILFSTPMVQAITAGRKTQTRRVIKPQPKHRWNHLGGGVFCTGDHERSEGCSGDNTILCPYGEPGDVLWVRETWCKTPSAGYCYKANTDADSEVIRQEYLASGAKWAKWKPSIHMPKAAARIWLEITNVRVERLQDITNEDAINEGIEPVDVSHNYFKNYLPGEISCFIHPKHSFESLWQSINGPESWNANPWVWVVEFKQINKPNQ